MVVEMNKGSSEKKVSIMAAERAGLNSGSKSNTATGANGGTESASFSSWGAFGLSKLHMEKSIASTNGEYWRSGP